MAAINNCIKCNIQTPLKRYCRACIINKKIDRQDMQDINKCRCNRCRCYKLTEEFTNIFKNCKQCRTRKENRLNTDNNNKDIKDGLEEEDEEETTNKPNIKKVITKVNYNSKLTNIIYYLKNKYAITETLQQLSDMEINLLPETEEEAKD